MHASRWIASIVAVAMTWAGSAALGALFTPASAVYQPMAASTPIAVDDAILRWGLNNETNAAGYAPGTWNLMSAGLIDDPGQGGQSLRTADEGETWSNGMPAGWVNREGNVTIEDLQAGGGFAPTTFAGTREDSAGTRTGVSNGVYAETEAVFRNGVGSYDPDAGTAEIAWDGDLTVLFYSGMTFFYVSDPVLRVAADGTGTVTATVDGFKTSMDDMTQWEPLDSAEVTIATMSGVSLTDNQFALEPEYLGVLYNPPPGGVSQVRSGPGWGSFPSSFVDWVYQTGGGPYWYSSGGAADARKPALPLKIGFAGVDPINPGDPADPDLPEPDDPDEPRDPDDPQDPGGPDTPRDPGGPGRPGKGTPFTVDDAVFRWGLNNESNNRGFAPGTFNFLSAGRTPNPGKGYQVMEQGSWPTTGKRAWWAKRGDVTIEKVLADGSGRLATWQGLGTGPNNEAIPSPTSGVFSNHQAVIKGGAGKIDPDRRTAKISWKGSFSVVFYSGMSYFTITNPTLTVKGRKGAIKATVSGFAADMDDPEKWEPLPSERVTIANLGRVELGGKRGFVAPVRYHKVRYDAPAGYAKQLRTGSSWGGFPPPLLDFLTKVGMGAYWYSSGGSTDQFKAALPATVSWDSIQELAPAPPRQNPVETPIEQPPPPPLPAQPGVIDQDAGKPATASPDAVTDVTDVADRPGDRQGSLAALASPAIPPTAYAMSAAVEGTAPISRNWQWWGGALLLLCALGLTLVNPILNRKKGIS